MKTMTKIVNTESQNRKDFKIPKKDTLDLLAASSAGDIRACINSLQFYCTNGKIFADSRKRLLVNVKFEEGLAILFFIFH